MIYFFNRLFAQHASKKRFKIESVIVFPYCTTEKVHFGVVLYKLSAAIDFSKNDDVKPLCLPFGKNLTKQVDQLEPCASVPEYSSTQENILSLLSRYHYISGDNSYLDGFNATELELSGAGFCGSYYRDPFLMHHSFYTTDDELNLAIKGIKTYSTVKVGCK